MGGLGHKQGAVPRERDPLPTVQEVGLFPGPLWKIAAMSPLPEFDPRTDQPVDSHFIDYIDWSSILCRHSVCPSLLLPASRYFVLITPFFIHFFFIGWIFMHHIMHICYSHWFHEVSLFSSKLQVTLDTAE